MGRVHGRTGPFLSLLIGAVLVAGCTPSGAPTPSGTPSSGAPPASTAPASPSSTSPDGTGSPSPTSPGGTATPRPTTSWPTLPTAPPGGTATDDGGVPAGVIAGMVADLAGRLGVAESVIEVLLAQAVTWNDGSLGCPKPGMVYTQALVDGYWVVLGFDGVLYDYHASRSGYYFLCE